MARILIAEDEEAIRSLVARALKQDGHEVMTASDGAQALDVLDRDGLVTSPDGLKQAAHEAQPWPLVASLPAGLAGVRPAHCSASCPSGSRSSAP